MDLINDVAARNSKELQERLSSYETTVMILAHNGDLPDVTDFSVIRVSAVSDLASVKTGVIVAIGDDDVRLAEMMSRYPDILGFNIVLLTDVPGQESAQDVVATFGAIKSLSLVKILADIADKRLIEANMSASELEASVAKRQDSLLRTKAGEIRPLIDFDRGFDGEQEDAAEQ